MKLFVITKYQLNKEIQVHNTTSLVFTRMGLELTEI